jgi:amino-acid N-acetyltransferase
MTTVTIAAARLSDYDTVAALLEREHLPLDGLREHFDTAIVARAAHRIIGCSALEVYEGGALLRSVAVDAEYRKSGAGSDLTRAAIELATRRLVPAIYLLTTTAERFFSEVRFRNCRSRGRAGQRSRVCGVHARMPVDGDCDAAVLETEIKAASVTSPDQSVFALVTTAP